MKKNKAKIWKVILSASSLGLATTSVATLAVSCGHKNPSPPAKKYSWDEFKTAAEAESPFNIVKNSTINASGWSYLKDGDVSITSGPTVDGHNIKVVITSKSQRQYATFTAVYKDNTKYVVSVWNCTVQPKTFTTWTNYKLDAEAAVSTSDGILTILVSINQNNSENGIIPANWVSAFEDLDFEKSLTASAPQIQDSLHKIGFTIKSSKLSGQATIVATENGSDNYNEKDYWVDKIDDWNVFLKAAKAEAALNIVQNAVNAPTLWKGITSNDLTITTFTSLSPTIKIVIDSKSKNEFANFKITYSNKVKYNVKQWICTVQPVAPSGWNAYKQAAIKSLSTSANILAVLEAVQNNNKHNMLIPESWVAKFQDSAFASSLTTETPSVNDNEHTINFTIQSSNLSGQTILTAIQQGSRNFATTDFNVVLSDYGKWFYAGLDALTAASVSELHSIGTWVLELAPSKFKNLEWLKNEFPQTHDKTNNPRAHIYVIVSDFKKDDSTVVHPALNFNVSLQYDKDINTIDLKNDRRISSKIPVHLNYLKSYRTIFNIVQLSSNLIIDRDPDWIGH